MARARLLCVLQYGAGHTVQSLSTLSHCSTGDGAVEGEAVSELGGGR